MIDIYKKYREIINYLIFGFLTTLVSLITYYLLTITILDVEVGFELQIANVLSWCIGVLFAYFTNRKYVFSSRNESKYKEFIKFLTSRISTLVLDMSIMFIFVSYLKYNDQIIKLVSQIVVIICNYLLSKIIVFKKASNEKSS